MKKLITLLLTLCLMTSVLCVPALAADVSPDTVIRVSALKTDGTKTVIGDYAGYAGGWEAAATHALPSNMEENQYDRIIVDFYANWNANDAHKFGNGSNGFRWDTIAVPSNAKMTINLNGHTINRGITKSEINGEVIYIGSGADVIINDGTITGGSSTTGAGGIHISSKASVTLNKVNVMKNSAMVDDGAGISVNGKATLVMNEGCISDNVLWDGSSDYNHPYGALYVEDSTVILNKVTLSNNLTTDGCAQGVAIYADDSTVLMNDCVVSGNAVASDEHSDAKSVIAAYDSEISILNTKFIGNASYEVTGGEADGYDNALLFYLEDSTLTMEGGEITENNPRELFYVYDSNAEIKNVVITRNCSRVIFVDNGGEHVHMISCLIGDNTPTTDMAQIRVEEEGTLTLTDCSLSDVTFQNKEMIKIEGFSGITPDTQPESEKVTETEPESETETKTETETAPMLTPGDGYYKWSLWPTGSMVGEGSLIVVVALASLVTALASMGMCVSMNKKLAALSGSSEKDDE